MKLSVNVTDMVTLNGVLYIANPVRGEVVILKNVAKINMLSNSLCSYLQSSLVFQ